MPRYYCRAPWRVLTFFGANNEVIKLWTAWRALTARISWLKRNWPLAWRQLWNFIVFQVKLNRFLHPNNHAQRIFWYLVKWFDATPLKIGIFWFSKSIFNAKTQLNLYENVKHLYNFWPELLLAFTIPILRIGVLKSVKGHLRTCYWLILELIISNQ